MTGGAQEEREHRIDEHRTDAVSDRIAEDHQGGRPALATGHASVRSDNPADRGTPINPGAGRGHLQPPRQPHEREPQHDNHDSRSARTPRSGRALPKRHGPACGPFATDARGKSRTAKAPALLDERFIECFSSLATDDQDRILETLGEVARMLGAEALDASTVLDVSPTIAPSEDELSSADRSRSAVQSRSTSASSDDLP